METGIRTPVLLTVSRRIHGRVAVSAWNTYHEAIRVRILVCGVEPAALADGRTPEGLLLPVRWSLTGGKILFLPPSELKTSLPFVLGGDKPHFAVYGVGEDLTGCSCELLAVRH